MDTGKDTEERSRSGYDSTGTGTQSGGGNQRSARPGYNAPRMRTSGEMLMFFVVAIGLVITLIMWIPVEH
ncbi:hypothetical protein F4821DRAFT_264339 [Hypoxylon rubiginosum]|uniref:Uncharacterized protein n=1 Tax=Hypoxylon rubiginosum TaxID=110542 RepID=A0ACC0CNL4_9PEZI|nr:hypothetical protein F4821DRAFT_264339 [Hypoxylon rubiginosum]